MKFDQPEILIQLYSVHQNLLTDYAGTLKRLRQAGATHAELYWFDAQPDISDMKQIFSDSGIQPRAMHVNLQTLSHAMPRVIDTCHHLAIGDVIMPWIAPELRDGRNGWHQLSLQLGTWGRTLRSEGIDFGYHNHDFEFAPGNDELPMKMLLDATHVEPVFWEIDTYWVKFAGQDVLDWLQQYGARIRAMHFKDHRAGRMVELGTGDLPWKQIIHRISSLPIKYWILEQEQFSTPDPWGELARGLAYLRSCRAQMDL